MKKILTAIITAVTALLSSCSLLPQPLDKGGMTRQFILNSNTLVKYYYRVNGDVAEPLCEFTISLDQNKQTCTLEMLNQDTFKKNKKQLPLSFITQIEEIINGHQMLAYESSYSNPDVLDGYSWALDIIVSDSIKGTTTHSFHGSNAGPQDDGMELIRTLVESELKQK